MFLENCRKYSGFKASANQFEHEIFSGMRPCFELAATQFHTNCLMSNLLCYKTQIQSYF